MPDGQKATEQLKEVKVGGADPLLTFRVPQESIDKLNFVVSSGQALSLSEAARTFLCGQLNLVSLGEEQAGALLVSYYKFLNWIADPVEFIMYVNFRSSLLNMPGTIKLGYAQAVADSLFKLLQLFSPEQQQQVVGVDGLDQAALSEAIMKLISGSPRVEPDSLKADAEPEKPPTTFTFTV